jgi:hypothetical protein
MPGKSIAYASVISVLAIVVLLGVATYQRFPAAALKAAQRLGTVLPKSPREVPRLGESELATDRALFEQASEGFLEQAYIGVGAMHKADKFDRYFSAVERTMDESVLALARHFDDSSTVRLATRPYTSNWIGEYLWLIRHLRTLGYRFEYLDDRTALTAARDEKTVFLRYDVHIRDLAPLYGILDANETLKLPAVAFIQWQYSDVEKHYDADYKRLAGLDWRYLHLGFHTDSAEHYFLGNRAYRVFLEARLPAEFEDRITNAASAEEVAQVASFYAGRIAENHRLDWKAFRSDFPQVATIALHGSPLRHGLDKRCASDRRYCGLWLQLMGEVTQACRRGSEECNIVDYFRQIYSLRYATDTWPVKAMLCAIQTHSDQGKSVQMLLHPAQFSRRARSYRALGLEPGARLDCPSKKPISVRSDE